MNVVFTLAGKSKRFKSEGYKKPKFLLKIGGNTILESIIKIFSEEDNFYFVFTKEQLLEYPEINQLIKSKIKKFEIITIDSHEKGPAFSSLQIKGINPSEPVIISYCDFLVEWSYKSFLSNVMDYDMVIPSFVGFHPCSFGDTYYAYSRINSKNELLELKEKQSFTKERHNELANAGIYYFKSYDLFKKYAENLIENDLNPNEEAFVSLIANKIVENKGLVLITEVNKYICLGTPYDYQMFCFWYEYFHTDKRESKEITLADINLIPMAGNGSRFKKEGYNSIKAMIQIENESMFLKTTKSFPKSKEWIFIFRDTPKLKYSSIMSVISDSFNNVKVITLEKETSGQAATCLEAKKFLEPKKSLFIASCDYVSIYNQQKWEELVKYETDVDIYIWTYKPNDIIVKNYNAFAYCKLDPISGQVLEVKEKETISENPKNDEMIIGSFWFRNANDFIDSAENAIKKDITVNGEHYIGNSLNYLINKGKIIRTFEVNKWVSFGDPFELEVHNYWEDFFFQNPNFNN
jgi:NDP-sugar pyrophosphorylase family protein